jgi:hypothetical protein
LSPPGCMPTAAGTGVVMGAEPDIVVVVRPILGGGDGCILVTVAGAGCAGGAWVIPGAGGAGAGVELAGDDDEVAGGASGVGTNWPCPGWVWANPSPQIAAETSGRSRMRREPMQHLTFRPTYGQSNTCGLEKQD